MAKETAGTGKKGGVTKTSCDGYCPVEMVRSECRNEMESKPMRRSLTQNYGEVRGSAMNVERVGDRIVMFEKNG